MSPAADRRVVDGPVGASCARRAGPDDDLAVLERDMLAAGPSAITGTTVGRIVVGGEVVHQTEGLG